MRVWVEVEEYSVELGETSPEFQDEIASILRAIQKRMNGYGGVWPADSSFTIDVVALDHIDEDGETVFLDYCGTVTLWDYSGFVWVGWGEVEYGDGHLDAKSRKKVYYDFDEFIDAEFIDPMIASGDLISRDQAYYIEILTEAGCEDPEGVARDFTSMFGDDAAIREDWIETGCFYPDLIADLEDLDFEASEFEAIEDPKRRSFVYDRLSATPNLTKILVRKALLMS